MSINGVILKHNYNQLLGTQTIPFELSIDGLETLQYRTKTSRQSLYINGNGSSINVSAKDGYIYLTTKRMVFITATQGDIDTFSIDLNLAPILQLSHKIQAPWFGANYWEFMFYSASEPSIASDGFPKNQYFKGEIRFQEGGLFEFIEVLNKVLNDSVNNREIDEELPQYAP
ncbi:uncharacterized protein J8A68_000934 [[Candida] subhashii]|uniref:GRAM domain-containing protein n=1 Tax=[Candida] subhashii TaxID=561895 RepID=A0A8J5QM10_9ASCO|nr:uncharacterized protein J8A68_000934 [[Candida] subhashii]KAG7665532.1 hypothetical protein J8A68_000934 [[Candida] subhashii]